ncbi:hypothetical protein [Paenibacillus eucommiae]|uniref:Uncharacterized protein n=1 Tax=Paenibacillus eucommiae TaxID=1355755 RepID=A0ABS4IPP0_9BACL|nr:hypothetical protein [Paenibacillus eucommiae]MBP1988589.1 hypothetical protein [Paenibacillus eucommiae]
MAAGCATLKSRAASYGSIVTDRIPITTIIFNLPKRGIRRFMGANVKHYTAVAEPCRNFNILGMTVFIDPQDGREKFVLSNCIEGSTGNLIFIDTETGRGEVLQLPGDTGAWALLYLPQYGRLLVGTCESYGYLHSLDLKSRTWAKPLRHENELYIWNLALGSDGMVYGGTYPGCLLLRYDPERHTLDSMGRVSDNPRDQYSRTVYGGVPGHMVIIGGYDSSFLRAYHIGTRSFFDFGTPGAEVRQITDDFICTEYNGSFEFFDPKTFSPISGEGLIEQLEMNRLALPDGSNRPIIKLASGSWAGVCGQDYFLADADGGRLDLRSIPVPTPPTAIHTVIADDNGMIWGATEFGQTIFSCNPEDGTYWNSSNVCNSGGEVYGMQLLESKLYLSAYAGGDHIVYDPQQPWDQLNNINPKTLRSVAPDLIRPTGRTNLGPDGGIWTGWSASYGTYGGGLSRIDPSTQEVSSWYDPIPGQQVSGLTADKKHIYFATNGYASGLPYNDDVNCHFAVWSPEGRVVFKHAFPQGVKLGFVLAVGGRVLVPAGSEMHLFDTHSMAFVDSIDMEQSSGALVALDSERAAVFGKDLLVLNVRTGRLERNCELPGHVHTAALTKSGDLYFAWKTILYRLNAKL